ncbi:hypothetical protein B0H10DRAFT_1967080 [Mycena sp. CBHHK59/15]|nr:hypothetical protein B0H10DRAFT_1967080 [Mycena sp. CBHHK59/15]
MEGAGGTIDDLAGLVVQYIRIVVGRHPPSLVSRSNSEYIRGICFSLRDADPSLETEQQRSLPPLGALHSILLHHGLVGTLVAAMLSVSSTPGPETGFVLDECFMLLERILLASPGYLWIEEAMDAGLIQVIVSCATFTQIGQELVSTEEFQTCDISSHWRRFMSLANERLEFLAEFDSAEFVSPTACDNLAMLGMQGLLLLRPSMPGGRLAAWAPQVLFFVPIIMPVSNPNRKTAELAHPQLLHLSHISAEQIKFITNNPTCKLFITLFNYCDGALQIEIHPAMASPLSTALQETGQEWMDLLSRAQRSEHRLHLHVVKVPQGLGTKHWVVPLRTSSPTFQQAMRLLATSPGDEDIMDAEILYYALCSLCIMRLCIMTPLSPSSGTIWMHQGFISLLALPLIDCDSKDLDKNNASL